MEDFRQQTGILYGNQTARECNDTSLPNLQPFSQTSGFLLPEGVETRIGSIVQHLFLSCADLF